MLGLSCQFLAKIMQFSYKKTKQFFSIICFCVFDPTEPYEILGSNIDKKVKFSKCSDPEY